MLCLAGTPDGGPRPSRGRMPMPVSYQGLLSGLLALTEQTYAPYPVWSGSTTKPVQFTPLPKKAAVRLWRYAQELDRQTKEEGMPRRRHRPYRPAGPAHADLRLPQLCVRPPRPELCRHRAEGQPLRKRGGYGAEAPACRRHPGLGAPLSGGLDGRPLLARAADQRLRPPALHRLARLPSAPRF